MSDSLSPYFDALERLRKGRPQRLPSGTKITNDAVALEAGRGRGSIKKSRSVFNDLLQAIQAAAAEQAGPEAKQVASTARYRASANQYRLLWEGALARELSLIRELEDLKRELARAHSAKVSAIRPRPNG